MGKAVHLYKALLLITQSSSLFGLFSHNDVLFLSTCLHSLVNIYWQCKLNGKINQYLSALHIHSPSIALCYIFVWE